MIGSLYGQVGPGPYPDTPFGLWAQLAQPGTRVRNNKGQRQAGPNGTAETANLGINSVNTTGIIQVAGMVTSINISMGSGLAALRKNGILNLYFDEGLPTANKVQIHLCAAFMMQNPLDVSTTGPGYDLYQLKLGNNCLSTRAFTVQYVPWWNGNSPSFASNGMRFRFSIPMPCTTFRMTIQGQDATNLSAVNQIWANTTYTPGPQSRLQFKASMTPAVNGTTAYSNPFGPLLTTQAYNLHSLTGKGFLMGHGTTVVGHDSNQTMSFLERDMSIYVDAEANPSFTWSSWEDYFESAFYANQGPWLQCNPFHFTSFTTANSGSSRQAVFCAFKEFQTPLWFNNGCIITSEFQPDKTDGFLNDTCDTISFAYYLQAA